MLGPGNLLVLSPPSHHRGARFIWVPRGTLGTPFYAPVSEPGKIEFYIKHGFLVIQVEIGEVWGCPGGAHGPYEEVPSNFGRIWFYMGSERPLFNI